MLTGLQQLFTVSFISRHLMTYHTPPRMTSKTCFLSPAWKPFHPPPSRSGDVGATSVRDPVHLGKNCILSPLRRLFSHSMTFSFWIPIFPHDTALSLPNFHPPAPAPAIYLSNPPSFKERTVFLSSRLTITFVFLILSPLSYLT